MKANELMLGDFVTFKDCQNDKDMVVIKIWDINQEGNAFVFIDDSEVLDEVFIDEDFVGIPLTPEILEKNGFVKAPMVSDTPPYDKDEEGNMHFSLNGNFWGWWQQNQTFLIPANGLGWLEFKYLHQLQHALKLCGIEKTIEL